MNFDLINCLLKSDLFKNFDAEEVSTLLSSVQYRIESYTRNDVVALRGDRCNQLMIIVEGCLIARMVADSGKFIQIEKMAVGRVLAPAMLFATENIFPVNVTPEHDASILVMSKTQFLEAMQVSDKLLSNFIEIISNINRFLSDKIHFLSLRSLRGKIAEYLLLEIKKLGRDVDTVTLSQSRQELADRFGVSRQSLVRSLSEMENEGLIIIKGKNISLVNKAKLGMEE